MEGLGDRELGVKIENGFRGLNLSMILENLKWRMTPMGD